jgi:hypothetical protein
VALELSGLLIVNVAYLAVGVALLALCGWLTWPRVPAAYLLGLVVVTVPASYLALVEVPVGLTASLAGTAVVALAAWRFRRARPRVPRPSPPRSAAGVAACGLALALAVLLAHVAPTFAVRPLVEWDGWAIWGAKARLLYEQPAAAPAALRSGDYGLTPYPLGLPTVEALGFGAMGRYDPTLIGVQFWLLALGFAASLWSVLQRSARSWAILLVVFVVLGTPQILYQLLTHYADVPLGLFVGLGVAAGAAWLAEPDERWLLLCFALFLGMAGVTKSEGFLFALAGVVALVAVARSRPALLAAGAVLALILPWRVYCTAYGLSTSAYDLNKIVDVAYLRAHASRVGPVALELARQLSAEDKVGLLAWAILLSFAVALVARRVRVTAFAGVWLVLSSAGLLMLYWVSTLSLDSHITNTSYRTMISLLVGGASTTPLLVFPRHDA